LDAFVVLKAFVALPIIFFVPGYVTFKALNVNKIENLKLSLSETLFLQVLASIVITGWIALILAVLGHFSLWTMCGLLLAYSLVTVIIFRDRFHTFTFRRPSWNRQSAFLILLAVLAGCLFFHPFEDIFGFGDAYIYVNNGATIAKHGSIVTHDPLITSVPEDVARTFFFKANQQFNGLVITNYSTGEIRPTFLPMSAIWIAASYLIFGLGGWLYITPLFGLLAMIGVFLAAKQAFNWKVAAIASSILTMNYLQIWFSRSHSAEIMLQFMIFGGIFAFVLFTKSKDKFLGIVSALCLGLSFVTSIEATLIVIPIVIYFTCLNILGRLERHHFYFMIPFALSLLFALTYYATTTAGYVRGTAFASDIPLIALLVAACVPMAINILPKRLLRKIKTLFVSQHRKLQHFLTLSIVTYILYCLFTLPTTPVGSHGKNLMMLGWYLTPFVLALGIVGVILMIYQKPYATTYFFLGVMLIFFLFFVPHIHHAWGGPWWMRRYIFAVIPMLCVGAGYCVHRLTSILYGSWQKFTLPLLVIFLIVSTLTISYPIINYIEYEGTIQQTEEIFGSFGDDSILVFADCSYPHIAYPLRHIFDKNALLLRRDYWGVLAEPKNPEDADKIMQAYTIWSEFGKKVYIINPSGKFIQAFKGKLNFTLHKEGRISVPRLEISRYELPTNFVHVVRNMKIYEISSK